MYLVIFILLSFTMFGQILWERCRKFDITKDFDFVNLVEGKYANPFSTPELFSFAHDGEVFWSRE